MLAAGNAVSGLPGRGQLRLHNMEVVPMQAVVTTWPPKPTLGNKRDQLRFKHSLGAN